MMEYVITAQRNQYLSCRGKIIVNACPGSGKTTSIAYKLTKIIEEWDASYSGVASLSFTNVAKNEINEKFYDFTGKFLNYPHLVSTIDSFINQYITLPHYHLLGFKSRPTILEDYSVLDTLPLYRYKINNKSIMFSYKPSKIDIAVDGTFLFDGNTPNLTGESAKVFNAYCLALKKMQFEKGLLKNSDSLYMALKILKENTKVSKQLSMRFQYFIIDEAQDTSEVQHLIFEELIKNGLKNIELIGDPYQSLYEWREARPDLFIQKTKSTEWVSLEMSECRRSVPPIVKAYSIFRMSEHDNLYSNLPINNQNPIQLIYYNSFDNLIIKYEEVSSAHLNNIVLVRGKTLLNDLKATWDVKDYWKETPFSPLEFIYAKSEMERGETKAAITRIYKNIPELIDPTVTDYFQKKIFFEANYDNYDLKSKLLLLIKRLPSLEKTLMNWTHEVNELCKNVLGLTHSPSFVLKQGQYRPTHNQKVNEIYQQPINNSKVTTIHKVKGKTFDSVMLVLSSNSSGQNLSMKDFKKPFQIPDEKKRLLYVAMSRPRAQLVIAIPSESRLTDEQEILLLGSKPDVHNLS